MRRRSISTRLYGATTQKTAIFRTTVVQKPKSWDIFTYVGKETRNITKLFKHTNVKTYKSNQYYTMSRTIKCLESKFCVHGNNNNLHSLLTTHTLLDLRGFNLRGCRINTTF
jgi:hypothetical protein